MSQFPNKLKHASLQVAVAGVSATAAITKALADHPDLFAGQEVEIVSADDDDRLAGWVTAFDNLIPPEPLPAPDLDKVSPHYILLQPGGIPDRLSSDPKSPFHDKSSCEKIGVRINGMERNGDVREYCVSAGWAKIEIRKNGRGKVLLSKLYGKIEPFYK